MILFFILGIIGITLMIIGIEQENVGLTGSGVIFIIFIALGFTSPNIKTEPDIKYIHRTENKLYAFVEYEDGMKIIESNLPSIYNTQDDNLLVKINKITFMKLKFLNSQEITIRKKVEKVVDKSD